MIPAHNEAESLGKTLGTIRARRTDESDEVIVVDGASTDATPRVARALDTTVIEETGAGIGHGRNRGAAAASGTWLAFIDADTAVAPSYLGRVGHSVTVGLHGQSYPGVERTLASLFQLHAGSGRPSHGRVTHFRT